MTNFFLHNTYYVYSTVRSKANEIHECLFPLDIFKVFLKIYWGPTKCHIYTLILSSTKRVAKFSKTKNKTQSTETPCFLSGNLKKGIIFKI